MLLAAALQTTQAVVGGVLDIAQRRIIKNGLDESINCAAELHHHHASVNQFRGAFSDHVNTQNDAVIRVKMSLSMPAVSPMIWPRELLR